MRKLVQCGKYFRSRAVPPYTSFTVYIYYWSQKWDDFNFRGLARAKQAFKSQNYEDIIPACNEEIETENDSHKMEAFVLRATFHLLLGEHKSALTDFQAVIENEHANVKVTRAKHIKLL
jgi:hypothetical protein